MAAEIKAPCPSAVGEQPLIGPAGRGILPDDIARAVMVHVGGANDVVADRMSPRVDARSPLPIRQKPNIGLTASGIEPEHVARTVMIEIADRADLPACAWMHADVDATGPCSIGD